ncbi:hypothetical protein [Rhodococcoides yunnanense]|uniref:hypothetical protein n=1 Tax=Rhodococcoides yunnanense TaxID=278209 RepID=UPI0009337013|nr:hypothetical protein [Rhodococcus yunnanensis]
MSEPTVRVADYPQLRAISWHVGDDTVVSELAALQLYERNWRFVGDLDAREQAFIQHLADVYSGGKLLV